MPSLVTAEDGYTEEFRFGAVESAECVRNPKVGSNLVLMNNMLKSRQKKDSVALHQ